jgi:hypothetical protein
MKPVELIRHVIAAILPDGNRTWVSPVARENDHSFVLYGRFASATPAVWDSA